MANQWFKFYGGEFLSDTKIERLSAQERSCWLTILCLASVATEGGVIEFLTVETLLKKSGIELDPYHPDEWDKSLGVLKKFQQMKMIEMDEEGIVRVLNWEKRQEHNLTVAERVAKSRANKKCNENVTINVTSVTTEENRIEENRIDINTVARNEPPTVEKDVDQVSEWFEEFYKKYPNKVSKKKAQVSFSRIKGLDHEKFGLIMLALERYKISPQWVKNNGDFVPHPTTWINQERWNDEIKEVKKQRIDTFSKQ